MWIWKFSIFSPLKNPITNHSFFKRKKNLNMKYFYILIITLLSLSVSAQTQIPESGFNNWVYDETNGYYEPAGNWWATLNFLASLGGPITVSPTQDAHSGEFAAKLESMLYGNLLITGLLAAGEYSVDENQLKNGRPFTDTPSKVQGWYKYLPVNNDSAGVGVILTKYNFQTNQQDTIASAVRAITTAANVYTQFEINFEYFISDLNPDTIIVVFTSSGDGGNFQGQEEYPVFR